MRAATCGRFSWATDLGSGGGKWFHGRCADTGLAFLGARPHIGDGSPSG
jgi:hypothetical protein